MSWWTEHVAWRVMPTRKAHAALDRARTAATRARGIAAGLCVQCGCRPRADGFKVCAGCRGSSQRSRVRREDARFAAGLCVRCGEPREPERSHLKTCGPCVVKANGRRAERKRAA